MKAMIGFIIVVIFGILILFNLKLEFGGESGIAGEMYIEKGVSETGAVNLVSAILANYRAYDTLGETIIFFIAILGVFTVLKGDKK
ncbi:MAG: hypothetical protein J7J21_01390 [Methanomicrobia archaeon]|nr:hypothetical protein [Methanomicrobia archaeon]